MERERGSVGHDPLYRTTEEKPDFPGPWYKETRIQFLALTLQCVEQQLRPMDSPEAHPCYSASILHSRLANGTLMSDKGVSLSSPFYPCLFGGFQYNKQTNYLVTDV